MYLLLIELELYNIWANTHICKEYVVIIHSTLQMGLIDGYWMYQMP
jgi:hypothetical protein